MYMYVHMSVYWLAGWTVFCKHIAAAPSHYLVSTSHAS